MRVILAGLTAMLLYSGSFVMTKHGLAAGLAALDIMMLRYLAGGLLAAVLLWRMGLAGLTPARAVILTLLGGVPYFAGQVVGIGWSSAAHAAVLNPGGTVVFATLLGWVLLRDPPGRGALAAIPLLLIGLVLISGASFGAGAVLWGDAVLLATGLQWALYGTLLRAWGVSGLRAACVLSAFSLPVLLVHGALQGWSGVLADPAESLMQVLFQGIAVGILANALYSHCYAVLGPGRAAIFPPLVPVLGTLLAALVLGEVLHGTQLIGMALVVAGMLLAGLWRQKLRQPDTSPQ
jgi:drug/metabolite transporter (DMT)-like permease